MHKPYRCIGGLRQSNGLPARRHGATLGGPILSPPNALLPLVGCAALS